jgi:hypothetical protein
MVVPGYGTFSEVVIDPSANPFVSGAFRLIDRDEPRHMHDRRANRTCSRQLGASAGPFHEALRKYDAGHRLLARAESG